MRYFYDCEFIEDGRTIELVSLGVVADDGREFYAVSTDADHSAAGPWVRRHVLPKLPNPSSNAWMSRARIRDELYSFLTAPASGPVELWAWIGAYDHVAVCQLWGDMTALPAAMPKFTRDVRQLWESAGKPELPAHPGGAHDALGDARHVAMRFGAIASRSPHPGL
ncbi:MAG TPA: polyadenylate-specific 3'-exoribonuclease AS [Candidatus Dietzia intestinipullorum]|nr:polyadenylate-specific 3'-exoribonuclease AS [Candidatus Dietzia intestinipullorum]